MCSRCAGQGGHGTDSPAVEHVQCRHSIRACTAWRSTALSCTAQRSAARHGAAGGASRITVSVLWSRLTAHQSSYEHIPAVPATVSPVSQRSPARLGAFFIHFIFISSSFFIQFLISTLTEQVSKADLDCCWGAPPARFVHPPVACRAGTAGAAGRSGSALSHAWTTQLCGLQGAFSTHAQGC